jgi:RimJ/RimL family protein N-acetyltransferase
MICGNKIGIRSVDEGDLKELMEWRNLPDFRKNFREHRELNLVNQHEWYSTLNKSRNDYMFSIIRKEDNKLIGAGGLLYINWIIRSADFSFYIGIDNLYIDNNGYANEAIEILLEYGFNQLNLNKIWMELYEFDHKKLNIFQKDFNFKIDGILRENCFQDGKYWNSYIISLLKKDYKVASK